jgi:hypothetical protein
VVIRLDDEVRYIYTSQRYKWKAALKGECGRVVEQSGNISLVEFATDWIDEPVWCANDALEVVSEEEKRAAEELEEDYRQGMEWAND